MKLKSVPPLDGKDLIPPPDGPTTQHLPLDSNGFAQTRTPGQVLYHAYDGAGLTPGGFFPTGVNGATTTSSSAA